ncbi:MAG: hypothetical protein ACYC66_04015 [Chloroflexota bacterium]
MVTLVSTLHDPDGRMVDATSRLYGRIANLYEGVAVVPTSSTSPRLLDALPGAIVRPLAESDGSIGVGRRHALRLGIESGARHLHYCDFDRVLHWVERYPEELDSALGAIQRHDYLILGRTDRAFATHPRVQRDTETITNHAFSLWYGKPVDVTAGSCGVSLQAAELLLRRSTAQTNATDAEWPALVCLSEGLRVGYLETEGLEFETPDYFRDEIARAGSLDAWLEERSRPLAAWIARTRLTLESLEAALAVVEGR